MTNQRRLSRRMILGGCIGLAGLASNLGALSTSLQSAYASSSATMSDMSDMSSNATIDTPSMVGLPYQQGDVAASTNGFDPLKMLTEFDPGKATKLSNGQIFRDYILTATNKNILLGPQIELPAVVYNGRLPGPFLRATQGDRIRITFVNQSNITHSINFAGLQPSNPTGKPQDMTLQPVPKGGQAVYEFNASHFGVYTYQAFANPMANTTFRGLFGMLIIDPPTPRPKALELAMVMSGSPLQVKPNAVPVNNIYAINAVAFQFFKHPINIKVNQPVRIYLANATEFDRINSVHLHANLFNVYRSGTSLTPNEFTDTVILCHGQTAILEFMYKFPGQYMFHAHQAIFSDEGWTSTINVTA
jgi:FtsP/CotA-like multicopper oxidase with cupredoxin domain